MIREKKNSGVQWISEIPANWNVRRLRSLGYFTASGIDKNIIEGEPLVHIVNYVDVYNNKDFVLRQKDYMVVSAPKSKVIEHQVRVGDMIFTPSSETKDDIGVSAVIMEELPNTAYSYHVLRFRFFNEDEVYIGFRKYFCNNRYVGQYFTTRCNGTIRQTLSRLDFKDCFVFLPPFHEQQAIADFLDTKCAEIDGLLVDLDAEVKTLIDYKKSIIAETVTHGLNTNATLVPTNLGWIDAIPKHWTIARIASVYSVRNEKVSDKDFPPLSVTMKGIVPQLESAAKTKHGDDRKLIRKGDFVINSRSDRRGSCGISDYDGSCSLINTVLSPREEMNPRYYNWLFHTPLFADEFYKWGYGIVNDLWTTNWGAMRRIQIPMPPLDEQAEIAAYLDEKIPHIEQSIADKLQQIEKLKEYKASLIYEYVTGKKQVI